MNKVALAVTSLIMSFVALLFLAEVYEHLNASSENEKLAELWKSKVAREQLRKLIVMGKFADFKQDVAVLIPGQVEKSKVEKQKNKLRNLASVIPNEGTQEILLGYTAEKLLLEGKEFVQKRDFKKGVKTLGKLIDKFPDSHHVVEAHYLLVETYYQQEKNKLALEWVEKMVEIFPMNRLTGFALFKAGSLYEVDGRYEDAARVYKIIINVYDDKHLISKAQEAIEKVQL